MSASPFLIITTMRFLAATAAIIFPLLALPVFGVTQIPIQKYDGTTTGRYIVQMKDGADKASLQSLVMEAVDGQVITHDWSIINGFAGPFNDDALEIIRANPHVQSVSEDGIMQVADVQTNATWGLRRISNCQPLPEGSSPSLLSYNYTYLESAGSGVDIYIVDTGVRITHKTFTKRAKWGATFGGYAREDGHGHGTHVAGTAAGVDYGVAKSANIIAVKVLSDQGVGSTSDIISGLNWVREQAKATGRPSVVNMSLGGFLTLSLNHAVASLTASHVHVVVAAGNSNFDSTVISPASAPSAVTVAATDINDTRPGWSNFGAPVKIFAPGRDIISSWNTNDTATNQISGTSMATPHVAGLIAFLISAFGNKIPAEMTKLLQNYSLKGFIQNVPPLTVNYLAQIPPSYIVPSPERSHVRTR